MARRNIRLNERNIFYIITNGAQSEKNYFELLKSKKSIFDIKVDFQNESPLGLVEYAIKKRGEVNQVWCVFDIDNTYQEGTLIKAINLAEKNDIKYAFSNLAFEVWLILHFTKVSREMNTKQHVEILEEYLKSRKCKEKYDKADKELLSKYFIPYYLDAINNAKIVHQNYVKEHRLICGDKSRYPIWKWNSCTTVYKLVEAMKLKEKNVCKKD